jgi:[acyl-carrier-protein] S-malonyltransferase
MTRVAFCFPGQGSQRVGMGQQLVERHPAAAAIFDEASEELGLDLRRVCFHGPLEELSKTEVTQPALVITSIAAARVVEDETGLRPDVVIGHSVGEYAALAVAGSVTVREVARLTRERGLATVAADVPGAMAAILGLADDVVEGLCAGAQEVWPANYNCPGQVVISGREEGVAAVSAAAKEAGGKSVRLRVAGAFHCPLMAGAVQRLEPALDRVRFRDLETLYMSTVSSRLETADSVPRLLRDQLTAPVRFTQAVRSLVADGVGRFVELGSGTVLTGLVKRIDSGADALAVSEPADLEAVREAVASG